MKYIKLIDSATCPEDLFRINPDGMKKEYQRLVAKVHPDRFRSKAVQGEMKRVFQILQDFKDLAEKRIKESIYGTSKVLIDKDITPTIIKTKRYTYGLYESFTDADICNVYRSDRTTKGRVEQVIFKASRLHSDNDLVENEIKTLTLLKDYPDDNFSRFYPTVVDKFKLKGDDKKTTQVIVLPNYRDEGYISLLDVKDKYGEKLNPRHVIWIFKRLLAGLGYLHGINITHGAILPQHILVHPVTHGIKILDWSYASSDSKPLKAISSGYRSYYPPEVLNKGQPGGYTDIYMAAKCLKFISEGNAKIPPAIIRFFDSCLISNPDMRPVDAWSLHKEFDDLAVEVYGKPKYVEMKD